jgi:PilZ domain-containing protein
VERLGAVATLPPPPEPNMPQVNRRKHARVKVSYSACVRHAERGDDIVTCEDMSRGGLRFKSHNRYYDRALIEVAVPYAPGQPAIFVPAQIVFIQELPEQHLFRYGVAYLQLPKTQHSLLARA